MSLPSTLALMTGNFLSACTAALTKKDMKPSLTPCSLTKASWNFLRSSMTGAMFTSLKVVRMALVACDCSRRSATRARRRVMGTRCSGRLPRSGAAGPLTCGRLAVGTPVGMDAGLAPPATAPSTSPLVTRPSLPVPGTLPAGRLLSAMSLAAAGMAMPALLLLAGAAALAAGAGAAAAEAGAGAAAAAPATASVSILASSCSAVTVAPSGWMISVSTPAAGEGTSSTTLSVSTSIRISSA